MAGNVAKRPPMGSGGRDTATRPAPGDAHHVGGCRPAPHPHRDPALLAPQRRRPRSSRMVRSVRYFRTDVFAWLAALTDGDTRTER